MGTTAAADRRGDRRRRARRRHDQGGADRRPLRRLHPGRARSTRRSTTSRWRRLGSIMGSGGMIVMDEDTNMVDVARFFMEFCMDESCGKCIPCRAGTVQMHRLLTRIAERRGDARRTWRMLEELCDMVKHTSLCGLGQSAPEPGAQHAALLPRRVRGAAAASPAGGRRQRRRPGRDAARRPRPPSRRAGDESVKADDHGASRRYDRRQARQRARGRDDPRGGPRGRHRDPDALPPRRGLRRRRLPALPGRGRRRADRLHAGLRHRRSPRGWRSGPTPSGSASIAG